MTLKPVDSISTGFSTPQHTVVQSTSASAICTPRVQSIPDTASLSLDQPKTETKGYSEPYTSRPLPRQATSPSPDNAESKPQISAATPYGDKRTSLTNEDIKLYNGLVLDAKGRHTVFTGSWERGEDSYYECDRSPFIVWSCQTMTVI